MKSSRITSITSMEEAKNEYKKFWRKYGEKLIDSIVKKKWLIGT